MSGQNIALLAVLALLVAVCLMSGLISKRLKPDDLQKQTRLNLMIKLAAALTALVIYLIVFIKS